MIIFFSTSVSDVSEHLPKVVAIGPIGICRGKDERAVQQAAALARTTAVVLNIFLVRLSIVEIVTSCLIMAFTPDIETAWVILFIGFITAIASVILDNLWGRQSSRSRW